MARVTVADCLQHVDNRFRLVLIATKRTRQLILGAEPMVEAENDKPTVLALREIAAGHIGESILEQDTSILGLDFGQSDEPIQELEGDESTPSIDGTQVNDKQVQPDRGEEQPLA